MTLVSVRYCFHENPGQSETAKHRSRPPCRYRNPSHRMPPVLQFALLEFPLMQRTWSLAHCISKGICVVDDP